MTAFIANVRCPGDPALSFAEFVADCTEARLSPPTQRVQHSSGALAVPSGLRAVAVHGHGAPGVLLDAASKACLSVRDVAAAGPSWALFLSCRSLDGVDVDDIGDAVIAGWMIDLVAPPSSGLPGVGRGLAGELVSELAAQLDNGVRAPGELARAVQHRLARFSGWAQSHWEGAMPNGIRSWLVLGEQLWMDLVVLDQRAGG